MKQNPELAARNEIIYNMIHNNGPKAVTAAAKTFHISRTRAYQIYIHLCHIHKTLPYNTSLNPSSQQEQDRLSKFLPHHKPISIPPQYTTTTAFNCPNCNQPLLTITAICKPQKITPQKIPPK